MPQKASAVPTRSTMMGMSMMKGGTSAAEFKGGGAGAKGQADRVGAKKDKANDRKAGIKEGSKADRESVAAYTPNQKKSVSKGQAVTKKGSK